MTRLARVTRMADRIPLPTVLSPVSVAFTIELDNLSPHRIPHRTTRGSAAATKHRPWLVMGADGLGALDDTGVRLRDLPCLTGVSLFQGLDPYPDGS